MPNEADGRPKEALPELYGDPKVKIPLLNKDQWLITSLTPKATHDVEYK